jgi:hypothetical protein
VNLSEDESEQENNHRHVAAGLSKSTLRKIVLRFILFFQEQLCMGNEFIIACNIVCRIHNIAQFFIGAA